MGFVRIFKSAGGQLTRNELPDILCTRQSLSSPAPFARFVADLGLFRFNPLFSLSRLVAMVTEISFARNGRRPTQISSLPAAKLTRKTSVETSTSRFMKRTRTMRTLRWAITSSLVGALFAGTAMAQAIMPSPVQQPNSIQQLGFQADESAGYAVADQAPAAAPASPSNAPPAPPPTSPAAAAGQPSVVTPPRRQNLRRRPLRLPTPTRAMVSS